MQEYIVALPNGWRFRSEGLTREDAIEQVRNRLLTEHRIHPKETYGWYAFPIRLRADEKKRQV